LNAPQVVKAPAAPQVPQLQYDIVWQAESANVNAGPHTRAHSGITWTVSVLPHIVHI